MLSKYTELLKYLAEEPGAEGEGGAAGGEGSGAPAESGGGSNGEGAGGEAGGEAGEGAGEGDGGGEGAGEGTGDDGGDGSGDGSGESGEGGESYADFEMPEGMEIDEQQLAAFTPIMKELGLSQEQAQKLVDIQAQQVQAQQDQVSERFSQQLEDWKNESSNDKEFGGDKFEQSTKLAVQAVDKFGTPELKTLLNDYGIGNHPEMIRFMYRVGSAIQEDNPGNGGKQPEPKRDTASLLYPDD